MEPLAHCEPCRTTLAYERMANQALVPAPPWDGLPMRTATRKGVPGDPGAIARILDRAMARLGVMTEGFFDRKRLVPH